MLFGAGLAPIPGILSIGEHLLHILLELEVHRVEAQCCLS